MKDAIKDLEVRKERALLMGGPDKIERQHGLGRYTARERIDRLLDPGSFMELGMLNHALIPGLEDKTYGDGVIAGLGQVDGRPVVVQAADKTVMAATEGAAHMKKSDILHEYAVKRRFPLFHLSEGGGLRIPYGMGSVGISENLFPMSWLTHGRQTPIISGILGDSFGGPTWNAVSADFTVQVKGTCMAVSGPRMLEIATSEFISEEDLGGWKIHAELTGQSDCFAENEDECIGVMKEFFSYMPSSASEEPPFMATDDPPDRRVDEVLQIVPDKLARAYDMRRLIRALVDDGRFLELKPFFGKALLTVMARLNGRPVGVVANQPIFNAGASGPQECDKIIEFICLCDSYNVPMVFLHDTPGFLIGSYAEQRKMPTKIMVWNQALAWSSVPRISVVIRKSIGASYANMCGPGMGGDFVVAWPIAQISFTGDEVGVNVVYGRQLAESDNPAGERAELLKQWSYESAPYHAAGKHLLDDVIDPRDTRRFLCRVLDYACLKKGSIGEHRLANWPTGY
ncbi:MAG: methylmalonyl-CoA decarboxylase [Proteobacteria bacterium]|nr:methylmalonyl-CoA decarboxylase [Pseudomonadota bacterium]